jgi:hypothetical protein
LSALLALSISDGGIVFLTLVCCMNMVAARIKPKPVCLMPSEKRACVQLASYCRACVSGMSRYHYSGIEKGLDHLWNDRGVSPVFKDAHQSLKVLNISAFSPFFGLQDEIEDGGRKFARKN